MKLVLATNNPNKVYEVRLALASLPDWTVIPQPDTIPPIEETGTTFLDNAILKAVHTSHLVPDPVLADDSGLCVDALDGRPGVFSNRYAPTDTERIHRLLKEMESMPENRRAAAFVCALALVHHGEVLWSCEGRVRGRIHDRPVGTNGFGYDPVFFIPEFGRTMAELTIDEKNRISHRGRALQQFVRHFAGSAGL